ncbi:hypothetical protein CVT24_008869 [Panaeolus cyanescens]|uniref:NAD-dependent epimerase/dehydratase domain-containing protein n=1 Tax=Panaeolus cyanescens TaxID=181874 RepID=A0A409VAW1_9AGAR|nr:hypothetical protein CVT24_008869 [Panaeolus cyanescens]
MPVISKNDKVLVTGANGYIAMWVVRHLLERGYIVRGTARNEEKCDYMIKYFAKLGYGSDRFEAVVVPDITKDGAFDEAVKGVDGIAHTASPFHLKATTPEELIEPAVKGTVGILNSVVKHGTNVKRIVVTSSIAAVITPSSQPSRFSEADWNEASVREVEEKGGNAAPIEIYRASKTLAERSVWDFYNKHKANISWDVAVINPPFPPIHDISSLKSLNTSLQTWYDALIADTPKTKEQLLFSSSWVDVRDTALAHVLALEKEAAGGERIITTAVNAANSLSPNPLPSHKLSKGFPEMLPPVEDRVYNITYEKSKEQRILGIPFRSKEETTKDTLQNFADRGW